MPIFENRRIGERRCLSCGRKRPLDWFGSEVKEEKFDERTGKTKVVARYRKYVSCWKCRALKRGRTASGKSAEVTTYDELIG